MNYHTIVTHTRPHLDECVAIWLLRSFGEELFPGIKKAEIIYVDAGSESYQGKSASELEAEGILMLGVGTGRFNEHLTSATDRKTEECTATLVAQALGIRDAKELEEILRYTLKNDTRGSQHKFELGAMIGTLHGRKYPAKTIQIWLEAYLNAKYQEQVDFWVKTADEYERIIRRERVRLPSGDEITVAICESDNELMASYARGIAGESLVILRSSSGHTQILKNRRVGLPMAGVVGAIRQAEAISKGVNIATADLSREGAVAGAENWHFQVETGAIMNGSLTARNVAPTRLALSEIARIVVESLREGRTYRDSSRHMTSSVGEMVAPRQ